MALSIPGKRVLEDSIKCDDKVVIFIQPQLLKKYFILFLRVRGNNQRLTAIKKERILPKVKEAKTVS